LAIREIDQIASDSQITSLAQSSKNNHLTAQITLHAYDRVRDTSRSIHTPSIGKSDRTKTYQNTMVIFTSLIIRLFQLVFSAGTVFFSHNKSAITVFLLVFSAKRMGPMWSDHPRL